LTLIELYQARGQSEAAIDLLAEAAALPHSTDDAWATFEIASKIAARYVSLGQPDKALQVLNAAHQSAPNPPDSLYPDADWIGAFANIGAFDRASQLLADAPEGSGLEGRFRIATAYTDQHQYPQAITLLSQIPDGVLFPLPEYPDPKVELLNRILNEAIQQDQFATAKRAALVMQDPVDQVRAFMAIATAHQNQPRLDLAVAALDQSLAVANTIEQHGFYADRHSYYQMSNADLLTEIATGYWAAGAQEKAIATVQAALQSEEAFESDASSDWYQINSLKTIVKLARDWQQPDLLSAAVTELEAQIGPVPEQTDSPDALVEQITGLINAAYNPGQPLSESVTRNLARLETLRAQATEPQQQLAMLRNLVYVYGLTEQPQLVRSSVEQALPLIAPLSADYRDSNYTNLALAIAGDPEGLSQVLPLLSSPHKQVEVLLQLAQQSAAQDKSTQAIERFDQAVALAETALSTSDRDSLMLSFSNGYTFFNTGSYKNLAPRTAAEVMLMSRLPQSISDPRLRAIAWISFAPNLPPAEAQIAYTELSSTLATIPNDYAKRSLLWENFNQALAYKDFKQATQLANALDGEYRQSALGFVAITSAP
jgi:tetratricopeptide (TPR) repeat protein